MRTLVDIPDNQLSALKTLSKVRKTSRAEIIRQAITGYLAENKPGVARAFGSWKDFEEDGVAYQRRLRSEWDR